MADEQDTEAAPEAQPEAPPLWGEATFRRHKDGAADLVAQVKVQGDSVRIEAEAFLEKGEALTGPDGQAWTVAEVRNRADGGYSWATLAPAATPAEGQGGDHQEPLNQIAPEPEPEEAPPARGGRRRKPADAAEPSPSSDEPDADPAAD